MSMAEFEKAKDNHDGRLNTFGMVMTEAQKESTAQLPKAGYTLDYRSPGAGTRSGAQSDDYPARSCAGRDLRLKATLISASRQKLESQSARCTADVWRKRLFDGVEHSALARRTTLKSRLTWRVTWLPSGAFGEILSVAVRGRRGRSVPTVASQKRN